MKRVLCLLLIACSIHVWGQDFASKFMEQCAKEDGDIQCQTVSPIMMEKLMDTMTAPDGDRDEEVPCGSRVGGADIRRGAPASGKRRYPVSVKRKS